jgi:hypothetical protein
LETIEAKIGGDSVGTPLKNLDKYLIQNPKPVVF